jgi:ribonuclease P protein component
VRQAGRLRRWERLRSSRDFVRVARFGRRSASREFVVLIAPARIETDQRRTWATERIPVRRLGVTVSRKVGNAVVRNQVKRAVREWFRHSRCLLDENVDVVVIARPQVAGRGSEQIARALSELVTSKRRMRRVRREG